MRYHEIIDEKVVNLELGHDKPDLKVLQNPTWSQIQTMLRASPEPELRGLIDPDGYFFVWPAFDANHSKVALELMRQHGTDMIDADLDSVIIRSFGEMRPEDTIFSCARGPILNSRDPRFANLRRALPHLTDRSSMHTSP